MANVKSMKSPFASPEPGTIMNYSEAKESYLAQRKWSLSSHLCALAGIVGPILFLLVFTIDGLLRPGYSPIYQMISDLGLGTNAWIQNANFVVFGLLLSIFAFGFYQRMRPVISGGWLTASTIFLVLVGVGLVNEGIFTKDAAGIHVLGFLVVFCSLITAFFIIGMQLRKIPAWRGYSWYSMLTGLVTLALLAAFIYVMDHAQAVGLFHRILVVEAFGWYTVMGCRLMTLKRPR